VVAVSFAWEEGALSTPGSRCPRSEVTGLATLTQ